MMPLACALLMPLSPETRANDNYDQAVQLYQQGEFQRAREIFASIPGFAGRFAEGSAAYQLGQFQLAIPLFVQAILDANTEQQRSDAIFNLANSYFKLEDYSMAKSLYQDVLRYQPARLAAQTNLKYATALIEEHKTSGQQKARRAGTGPRTAEAPPDLDVGLGRLSLGDSTDTTQDEQARQLTTPSQQGAEQVLQQTRPASGHVEYDQDLSWTYDIKTLSTLQQSSPRIDTNESVLWQRLFEVEEDFEAAQDTPNPVPGVKPW
jgi:Ca-activated chloride channel family protein